MIITRIDTSPEYLKSLLSQLSISAEELAIMAGVHRTTAFAWISDRARIPVSVIRMLELTIKDQTHGK